MKNFHRWSLALAAFAAAGAAVHGHYQDLRATRSEAAAAWHTIGELHTARERTAHAVLAAAGGLAQDDVDRARAMLSQVRAVPADPGLLDDPRAIDTYKRYQGELTGALFVLVFKARTPDAAKALDGLRNALPRYEAGLAQARQRYRHAALRHNANAATPTGTLVGALTGQGPVPPEL